MDVDADNGSAVDVCAGREWHDCSGGDVGEFKSPIGDDRGIGGMNRGGEGRSENDG